jgi:hypothetical protein
VVVLVLSLTLAMVFAIFHVAVHAIGAFTVVIAVIALETLATACDGEDRKEQTNKEHSDYGHLKLLNRLDFSHLPGRSYSNLIAISTIAK